MSLVTSTTRENTVSIMSSLTQEQSSIVLNYVEEAERSLTAYSTSGELLRMLQNPDNQEYVKQAQEYTERFAKTIPGIEGIYTSNLDTQVLVHNNPQTVGIVTKNGEALNNFIETLRELNGDVYNSGIIISPATGKQIVSMYKIVCDENNEAIGLVGLGLYTDSLASTLDNIVNENSVSSFQMIDVSNNKYIFCNDKSKIGTDVTDSKLVQMINQFSSSNSNKTDYSENNDITSFYYYNAAKKWMFVNNQNTENIFQFSQVINRYFLAFCFIASLLIIAFNIISINQDKAIKKLEQAQKKQEAVTKSLYIASMIDPITNTSNRASIVDALEVDDEGHNKLPDSEKNPYYFILFNIPNFSLMNKKYGSAICDNVLKGSAEILKKSYGEENVYRTGSDEFIVIVKNGAPNINDMSKNVNSVINSLQKTRNIDDVSVAVPYISAIIKKHSNITPQIIDEVKELRKSQPSTQMIVQKELD